MKILAIRIKNLASLEGTTEIDFTQEPLLSAGIFAITGPTGAGKSTILDALCLALYARTPRYVQAREMGIEIADAYGNTLNQSDVRAILRDGMTDGFAEVDFVGVDEQHYRSRWSVRRARNRASGSLQQATIALSNLTAGNDIGGRKTELLAEIVRLVGLNYEQFIRSVLLAQGDFTAFLKADKDQKASLLEKLTGTSIYSELSKKIFERYRAEDQQLKLLQQHEEGVVTLTDDELVSLRERRADLEKAFDQLEIDINTTVQGIKWHEECTRHHTQIQEAERLLQERRVEKEEALDRAVYLKQVEQVQSVRTTVDALHEVAEQLNQRQETQNQARIQLQLLMQQTRETEDLVTAATDKLDQQTVAQEAAKPLLDEARKLDVQLQAKEVELAEARQRLQVRYTKKEAGDRYLIQQQEKAQVLGQQVARLEAWKEKHRNRQSIAENVAFIVAKLNDGQQQLAVMEGASKKAAQYKEEIEVKVAEHLQLVQLSEALAKDVRDAEAQLAVFQKELSSISITQLQAANQEVVAEEEDLRNAVAHWQRLSQAMRTHHQLTEKIETTRKELVDNETQQCTVEESLRSAVEQRNASAALLEKATLAASENVTTLRNELVAGDPCPVCGSETHPYVNENPQLNHVLAELKKAHEVYESAYRTQLTHHSQLTQRIALLRQALETLEIEQQASDREVRSLTAVWEGFAVARASRDLTIQEREGWLSAQLAQTRARRETLTQQLTHYQTLQSQRDVVQQTWQRQQAKQADTANAVKDHEGKIQLLNERLAYAQSEQTAGSQGLNNTLASLQRYFPDDLWVANWKGQPEAFVDSIQTFANEWKRTTESLDRDRNALEVLKATLTGLQAEVKTLDEDIKQAEHDVDKKEEVCRQLIKARQSIFNGESVEQVEARLKQQITKAQEALSVRKQELAHLQIEVFRTEAKDKEAGREVARLEQRAGVLSDKLKQWLVAYQVREQVGLDRAALEKLLQHSPEWIAEERHALLSLERAVNQVESILEERRNQLAMHEKKRPSDCTLDDLQQQLEQQQSQQSVARQEYTEIAFRLRQDETHKQQLGDLLVAIRAQAEVVDNWSKLNDLIGSADGKKFRQVAQEYTLDVLLRYANVQLEVLSTRYRLQRIPNTLGLQVLDQDMGDEVRTVYSLSGGESFLVSLALALGLASLSANRMNVESLFIDEGFGSLDPNTLNIAMDALERLHNQGRKVGVISHVQEMTERIPVQIQVSKQQNGRSRVEVH